MEAGIARCYGTCMTMGTASTMTAIAEAIGMTLPGASSIPAADANHIRMCAGVRPAHRRDGLGGPDARQDPDRAALPRTPSRWRWRWAARPTPSSTCIAMARRAGHDIGLEDFDAASRKVPVIANIRPSGDTYLMEDFYYAGGLPGADERGSRGIWISTRSPSPARRWARTSTAPRSTTTTSSARSTSRSTTRARWPC